MAAASILLAKVGISPPPRLHTLTPPSHVRARDPLPMDRIEARSLLTSQRRRAESASKPVEHTLRNVLTIKRLRQEPNQSTSCLFTTHEVARLFDNLLDEEPLRPVGVAYALLLHAGHSTLDQLWHSRPDAAAQPTPVPWLANVTSRGKMDYVTLLCEMGPTTHDLSAAFRIAWDKGCIDAMELLLSYGADTSCCRADMRKHMQPDNMDVIQLLLAAPCTLTDGFWQECLHPCERAAPAVLSQCLSHRPTLANERMLDRALAAHQLDTTAVLLAYTDPATLARYSCKSACSIISKINAPARRYAFFDLLHVAGFLSNNSILRNEVLEDVKNREIPLVRLLVKAGVTLDVGSDNAFRRAVTDMDLEMVDALRAGTLENAAAALDWIPDHGTEQDIMRLLDMLAALDLAGDPLHRRLIVAVRRLVTWIKLAAICLEKQSRYC